MWRQLEIPAEEGSFCTLVPLFEASKDAGDEVGKSSWHLALILVPVCIRPSSQNPNEHCNPPTYLLQ